MPKIQQKEIVSAIIVVGFLIAGAILLKDSKPPVKVEKVPLVTDSINADIVMPADMDDHIVGSLDAKVIVVEYSDLECPFCKVFHQTMQQTVSMYDGDVAWVFRHYPIPQLHPKAFHEAEATECAWEQGGNEAFWKYTNRVFEVTPSNNGLEVSELSNIAKYIGLDVKAFETCLDSGKFVDKIQADITEGSQAGVSGTPSSFIFVNGKMVDTIPGAEQFPSVKQKIDKALKQ